MGEAAWVYFKGPDGPTPVSAANPLPVGDSGAVQASEISADAPVTWDSGTSTVGISTDTAGGVPVLDANGLVKLAQMPISGLNYHGNWDASTNTPTLADGTGAAGDMYRVHVAGSQDLGSGSITFDVGDLVVYEGAVWQKFAAATGVISVNGQTGAVSLAYGDLSGIPITRVSGTVALQLDGEELAWPTDILNGKVRLYNTTPASNNTFYGFGIANGELVYQVDSDTSAHHFQGVDDSDGALDILHMSAQGGIVAAVPLHMSEKQIVNVGHPDSDRDAATKQYVDQAVAGVGGGHLTVASHAPAADIALAAGDPTVQLIDASARGQALVITLPDGPPTGKVFTVKKVDSSANTVNLLPPGSVTINGEGGAEIAAQNSFLSIVFDGTNWQVIAAFNP